MGRRRSWTDRIIDRLREAEAREVDAWHREDYAIARITAALAGKGQPNPDILASYEVLGLHPEKVWRAILERRKRQCGRLYDRIWEHSLKNKRHGHHPVPLDRREPRLAAHATAYRNSRASDSRNSRFVISGLAALVYASTLKSGPCDRALAWLSVNESGDDLYMSQKRVAHIARCSDRTVRRDIVIWSKEGLLEPVHGQNVIVNGKVRRTKTYRMNPEKLTLLEPWEEAQRRDRRARGLVVNRVPPQSVKTEPEPASLPPAPVEKPTSGDGNGSKLPKNDRDRLTQHLTAILRGDTLYEGQCFLHPESGIHHISPAERPRCFKCYSLRAENKAPRIDTKTALIEACRRLDIPFELGVETYALAKLSGRYGQISHDPPKEQSP